ncbi:MAG: hypothetical protein ACKO40_03915 [Planctomycetaceae bacterium]
MKPLVHAAMWLATISTLTVSTGDAWAVPPRSERVTARIAERAYARQSIAEARAARAEARVAEIAPLVPVPPPPRPATVRRMARAGVPLVPPAPLIVGAPAIQFPRAVPATPPAGTPPAMLAEPARATVSAPPRPSAPLVTASPQPTSAANLSDDGTRSVLTTAEEPAPTPATREPAGSAVTHPPIELLPTPQPQGE